MTLSELKFVFCVAVVLAAFSIPTLMWLNAHEPEIVGAGENQTKVDQCRGGELNGILLAGSVGSPVVAILAGIGILWRRCSHG